MSHQGSCGSQEKRGRSLPSSSISRQSRVLAERLRGDGEHSEPCSQSLGPSILDLTAELTIGGPCSAEPCSLGLLEVNTVC